MSTPEMGNAEHTLIDTRPGNGKLEGKAVLTLHFGTMYLRVRGVVGIPSLRLERCCYARSLLRPLPTRGSPLVQI